MAEADPDMNIADTVRREEKASFVQRWARPLLLYGVPALLIAAFAVYFLSGGNSVSTDNAYVQRSMVSVSADVSGRIVEVAVAENDRVEAGDLLFRIDPEPYRIAVEKARAALADAQVNVETLRSNYAGTSTDIEAARDRVAEAQETYRRQEELMERGFNTRARLDQAHHALNQARAELSRAKADAAEARSRIAEGSALPGENPAIAAARSQLESAQLNLARTEVHAPVAGVVSQADRLEVGQQIATGLPAVTIVADKAPWVEANFKETDLTRMKPGQTAHLWIDAYPDLELKGHVASIGAGTGSEFSVLPAQNANGNWVKVTQRVPVRIALDEQSPQPLIAGLSAEVEVELK